MLLHHPETVRLFIRYCFQEGVGCPPLSRVGFRPVVFSILNKFRLRTRSFCPLYADPTARSHQALHLCCRQTGPADAPGLLPDGALVWLLGLHLSPCGRWGLHLTGALLPPACGCPSPHSAKLLCCAPFSRPQGCLFVQIVVFPYLLCAT